jgi:hypothetical protein
MCGCPSRLKTIRSIALASVAVPTVERGRAHPLLVDDDRGGQPVEDVDLGRASVGMKPCTKAL